MVFDWKEYINLSKFLLSEENRFSHEEASWRCAISRVYFAAFCYARNTAVELYKLDVTGTDKDHPNVRQCYRENRLGRIASKLDQLRIWRNMCDYENVIEQDLEQLAKDAVKFAENVYDWIPSQTY